MYDWVSCMSWSELFLSEEQNSLFLFPFLSSLDQDEVPVPEFVCCSSSFYDDVLVRKLIRIFISTQFHYFNSLPPPAYIRVEEHLSDARASIFSSGNIQ